MKIVQRYILREFLVPLFYCLTGFIAIYVLFELFGSLSRMMEAHFPLKECVLYFCGYLAPYFHYLAPAALMLATLYTMWNMCRHSEIVAMRASGISFMAIVRPLLMTSIVLACFVGFVSEWFVPRYAHWASQLKATKFDREKLQKGQNIIFRNSVEDRTWEIREMLDEDGTALKDVCVRFDRPNGVRLEKVNAERADYLDGEWWFKNVTVQHYDANGSEIKSETPVLDQMTLRCYPELTEIPSDFIMQNRPWSFNSVRERFRFVKINPTRPKKDRDGLLYDAWAQLVAPWACVIVTLFAIPAGISSGRQSVFKGILGALGMFFGFYGLTIICMILAKCGFVPPLYAALAPGAIFLVAGFIMFRKVR